MTKKRYHRNIPIISDWPDEPIAEVSIGAPDGGPTILVPSYGAKGWDPIRLHPAEWQLAYDGRPIPIPRDISQSFSLSRRPIIPEARWYYAGYRGRYTWRVMARHGGIQLLMLEAEASEPQRFIVLVPPILFNVSCRSSDGEPLFWLPPYPPTRDPLRVVAVRAEGNLRLELEDERGVIWTPLHLSYNKIVLQADSD